MDNTLLSHELEEMRAQISILKDKLEKQTIVNESHIRLSMKSKVKDLNSTIKGTVAGGIFALIYCPIVFAHLGCSVPFVIVTTVMLAVCLILTIRQKVVLGRLDFSQGNLVEIAQSLGKIRKHYVQWTRLAAPAIVLPWFGWCLYEFIKLDSSPTGIFLCVCGAVGGIIGGIIGICINRKVVRKTDEILVQVEELQR
ncbi:MAG: hypothetical protein IJ954_04570 [Bacteroidales bacterium]|nr:hypothetical protein [Bacteroidales bacterium]